MKMQNVTDGGERILSSLCNGQVSGQTAALDDFLKPKHRQKLSQLLLSLVKGLLPRYDTPTKEKTL